MKPSVYVRPDKPKTMRVTRRGEVEAPPPITPPPEPVMLDKSTECHVTPVEVAEFMVEWADIEPGMRVLEPSAGTGNILYRIPEGCYVVAVEKNVKLWTMLNDTGRALVCGDFLHCSEDSLWGKFDRVVMNPPFSEAKKHVKLAYDLLKEGGVLVALVPVTFDWAGSELLDTLPNTTFALAKVNTKVIRINK